VGQPEIYKSDSYLFQNLFLEVYIYSIERTSPRCQNVLLYPGLIGSALSGIKKFEFKMPNWFSPEDLPFVESPEGRHFESIT
jgi:hypothetical protein